MTLVIQCVGIIGLRTVYVRWIVGTARDTGCRAFGLRFGQCCKQLFPTTGTAPGRPLCHNWPRHINGEERLRRGLIGWVQHLMVVETTHGMNDASQARRNCRIPITGEERGGAAQLVAVDRDIERFFDRGHWGLHINQQAVRVAMREG